jgi:hypothetical protein
MNGTALLKSVYSRPYAVIFIAAAALSAHGLFVAAHVLAHIPAWLAWAYVLIVDLTAVSAYRTWQRAGMRHWAGLVAAGTAAATVTLNALAAFPAGAPVWIGPAIAAFPPVAALLATALRLEEQRLHLATEAAPVDVDQEPTTPPAEPGRPAPRAPRLTAIPAVTDSKPDADVAAIVAEYLTVGGRVTDAELTAAVAGRLGCSDRTARRRLQPFREGVAA